MTIFPSGFFRLSLIKLLVLSASLFLFTRGCTWVCGGIERREWGPKLGWTVTVYCLASSELYSALLAFMDEICRCYNTQPGVSCLGALGVPGCVSLPLELTTEELGASARSPPSPLALHPFLLLT